MSSTSKEKFIELNRTFHELSEHAGKSDDVDLSQVFHIRNRLTWDDVVKHPRTVVLSEAGSGKTEEIRNLTSRLRADGKAAFFLRLELIANDFEVAFEVGTLAEFTVWLASGDMGWLLLDSVDEARLSSPKDFERAIRKLGKQIEAVKSRVHIVLTGRTHAWRPKTDFDLCERHIGFPPQTRTAENPAPATMEDELDEEDGFDETIETKTKKTAEDSDPKFRIMALDDLSQEQIEAFAAAKGVADTSRLLDEIERTDAWPSTTRPQDLEEIIALWIDKGRIGTRLEIMQNSVDRRLMERDQDRREAQPLSEQRAREGAMLIAAAATLAQVQVIRVLDGAANTKGLDPKSMLTDWTDNDINALLSRPMFDNSIYGTVRFHHRSVREYLTAVWLRDLLKKTASRRAIEALLFRNQYGQDVVVPTMRPILPWLAIFDPKIRDRVREIAPEVIFEGGDPNALPLPTRREILTQVCNRITRDSYVHSATEYAAVQRFAQSDIGDDIRSLLRQYGSNDSIAGFLLRMVWMGRLRSLLLEAKAVALSSTRSLYTRIAAFRALRAIGSAKDNEDVRKAFLNEAPRLSREWIGELITDLAPSESTIQWVLWVIEKSEDKERYSIDRMLDAITSFTAAISLEQLPLFIAGMEKLLDEPPVIERGYCEVSKRFSWLMKPAADAVERLIKAKDRHALHTDSLEVLYKFRAASHWNEDVKDIKIELSKLVPEWLELNDASFWHDVSVTREFVSRKGERLTDWWQAQIFGAFWKFGDSDFDRVCGWIDSRPDQDDKLVALTLAFLIYTQNGKIRAWQARLKSACSGNSELEARLTQLFNPPPQNAEYQRRERKWKRQAARRSKKEADQFEKDKHFVQTHIELARDPKLPNSTDLSRVQWYLHQKLHEKRGGSNKWTDGKWRGLVPMFGEEVAHAYRDGAVAYWRRYKPLLRSEGAEANKTSGQIIFGLSGLAIEARETADWIKTLSEAEVGIATRYALHELNGFPTWFPALYNAHCEIAGKVILGEIEFELGVGMAANDTHYVLSDVTWSGSWAWNDLAPALFSMLLRVEPANASHLHQMLTVVQGSDISDAEMARLAAKKIADGNSSHVADWLAVWVGVEPEAAIPRLEKHLSEKKDAGAASELAMRFVTKLWGGRRTETFGARGLFRTALHLKTLYSLMHRHIRVADDIDRSGGGVFSPELRDDAQRARDLILQALNKIPGREAFLALQELLEANRQSASYLYLEMLCRQKAEQDSDLKPWMPMNVKEFHDRLDRTPSTHRELADLAVLRLLDLKDDLEEGDDSVAEIVQAVTQETMLRNFIGYELRQKAFGRYSIPQEEELADAKRPDLRFHGIAIDAPVPMELKIADNGWTGPALFERLENQLAGNYLRDIRSARGIFCLVYRGDSKARWQIPGTRQFVDFDGLVPALRDHWTNIASKFPGVDEITVIGIDLSKRGR